MTPAERRAVRIEQLRGRTGGTFEACDLALQDAGDRVDVAFRLIQHARSEQAALDAVFTIGQYRRGDAAIGATEYATARTALRGFLKGGRLLQPIHGRPSC